MNFRNTVVPPDIHAKRVESSKNGIAIYSDIHRCLDGILGIANIRVDANFSVRSVEYHKKVLPNSSKSAIPSPINQAMKDVALHVSSLTPVDSMRMILRLDYLPIVLNIGEVTQEENSVFTLNSQKETVKIDYFESGIDKSDFIKTWLLYFCNIVETHKPKELGLVLEALLYIQDYIDREIEDFDRRIIELIITSPNIEIQTNEATFDQKIKDDHQYDEKDLKNLRKIFNEILKDDSSVLVDLAKMDVGFVKSIFYVLILEKKQLVTLSKPN